MSETFTPRFDASVYENAKKQINQQSSTPALDEAIKNAKNTSAEDRKKLNADILKRGLQNSQTTQVPNALSNVNKETGRSGDTPQQKTRVEKSSVKKDPNRTETTNEANGTRTIVWKGSKKERESFKWKDGTVQEGEFKDGSLVKGKITGENGTVQEGEFKDGSLVKGKITWKDGTVQEGEFKGGLLVEGKKTWKDGNVYEGEFKGGLLVEGKKTWKDGEVQEGEFKDWKLVKGKITWKDGTKVAGVWKDGDIYTGLKIGSDGSYIAQYKNGERTRLFGFSIAVDEDANKAYDTAIKQYPARK